MHLGTRALVTLLTIAVAGEASAYTIKTSSQGAKLHWVDGEVVFTPTLEPAELATAVATWQVALASSAVTIRVAEAPAVAAPHALDGVNTLRWATAKDDPDIEPGILGNTFLAYRAADGEIQDADIVLNAVDFTWTTSVTGCGDDYDTLSAVTHELGHALGLAHSLGHPDATMYATGDACEIVKRDLDPDDTAAIAELYATPPAAGGGCDAAGSSSGLWLGLAAVVVLCGRRRALVVAAATLAIAGRADAAQLAELDLATLGDHAVMVVRGHVAAIAATPDGPLETSAVLTVDDCLAGACPKTVEIVRRGGERDGVGLWVDGEANLAVGADVVLYLRLDPRGRLRVLGGVQGALDVLRIAGTTYAVRDLRGHAVRAGATWRSGDREVHELGAMRRALHRQR